MQELNTNQVIERYVEHKGTIKISGKTMPKGAALCALSYLNQGVDKIEFFYIGGNAGQQATKAMSVFAFLVDKDSQGRMSVSFRPLRVSTITKDAVTGEEKEKDAVVWRTILNS